jgi:signal transduction histidine kinase
MNSSFLRVALLACALCLPSILQAQPKADSLRKVLSLHSRQDSVHLSLLLQLASQYELISADSIFYYGKKALSLATKNSDNKGIANATELLGAGYSVIGKYDSAIYYYRQSISLARKYNHHVTLSSKYNHIANAYFLTGRYADAHVYYDSAIELATKNDNAEILAKANSNLGNVFYKMGNYTRALHFYLKGLKKQEELGVELNIASDLSNIANVYYRLRNYDEAINYIRRANILNKKLGMKERLVGTLTTYAMVYNDLKKYDSSVIYLKEALQLAVEIKNPYLENIVVGNLAECYLKKTDYSEAEKLYEKSLKMSEQLGDAEGYAIAQAGLGEIYLLQGNAAKGRQLLTSSFKAMQQLGVKEQALSAGLKLSESYEKDGDFKNALFYRKYVNDLEDSLEIETAGQKAEQVVFDYEIQKKENEIKLLQKNKDIEASKSRTQRTIIWAAFICLAFAITIAYLLYRNRNNLSNSKKLILEQKEELELQAQRLTALNEFKDVTFSLLAHDLRSPINALAGMLQLLDEQMMTQEEFIEYRHELNSKLQSLSILLDNMLYWAKNQMKGENLLETSRLNTRLKVTNTISQLRDAAAQKSILVLNNVPDNLFINADIEHVRIILRNIIANAIKFTNYNGEIIVSAEADARNTYIHIQDNGVGMSEEQAEQLFTSDMYVSTRGTGGEKGTGLGLRMCYDLAKKNNGDIRVSSKPGKGSTFTVIFPSA